MRSVAVEVEHWQTLAAKIPDDALRRDAQHAIESKRANIDGAALFWGLPRARSPVLLHLLVAYEILADYLDCTSERAADAGIANGLQIHRALIHALDPSTKIEDYYKHHPWSEDGGYLYALIGTCRDACAGLPSYQTVKPWILGAARLTQVLALNHEPDPTRRDTALRRWAETHCPDPHELAWWERTGGASAWLTILALLALASEPVCSQEQARTVYAAYLPWISLTGTLLDSYGDIIEDITAGDHSYIGHYLDPGIAARRVIEITERSLREARALGDGHRHVVIVSCMIAMYLSKDSTRTPQMRATTNSILRASGAFTRSLVPVLRLWRVLYKQRST